MNFAQISIIIIGLNEGKNLVRVFQSLLKQSYPVEKLEVIYVDSGSEDRSVEIAKEYTSKVFIEKSLYPTAARGRNRGLSEATSDIVHFIDGDVEIGEHYIKEAVIKLLSSNKIAAVTGYITEINAKSNFLNKLFSSNLGVKKVGFVNQTKAGGTYKRKLLLELNGYDERIKLGEETELGERIINAGYKIVQIDELMGKHDYDFKGITSLLKLHAKMGESLVIQSLIKESINYWHNTSKRNYSNLIQNLLLILAIFLSFYLHNVFILVFLVIFFFIWLILKLVLRSKIKRNQILYYIIMNLMKPATFYGQIKTYLKIIFMPSFKANIKVPKMKLN